MVPNVFLIPVILSNIALDIIFFYLFNLYPMSIWIDLQRAMAHIAAIFAYSNGNLLNVKPEKWNFCLELKIFQLFLLYL